MDELDGDDDDEDDFGDEMFADEDLDLKHRWVWFRGQLVRSAVVCQFRLHMILC